MKQTLLLLILLHHFLTLSLQSGSPFFEWNSRRFCCSDDGTSILIYTFVARGNVILAKYNEFTGSLTDVHRAVPPESYVETLRSESQENQCIQRELRCRE